MSARKVSKNPVADRLADALFDKLQNQGAAPETSQDLENLFGAMMGRLLNRMLEGEMDNCLGYKKGQNKPDGSDNERNGHSPRTVHSEHYGELAVEVPRDRKGRFMPRAVPKYKRTLGSVEEKIIAMYARGLPVREIREMLAEQYNMDASTEYISNVTDSVLPELRSWQGRTLDPVYPVVFFDAIRVKIRSEKGVITPQSVYLALGIDTSGKKDVLGLWVSETESASFWYQVFSDLRNRGVQDILIAVTDGLKGMEKAIADAFPNTLHQTCIVHLIRNSVKYVSYKDLKAVTAALKQIYRAVNADAAREELDKFKGSDLARKYPYIAKIWEDAWDRVIPFFEFAPGIRKLIYTTNAIEGMNRQLRKVLKTRASFPTRESALKLMYLVIKNISSGWKRPSTSWSSAMREMAILFGDRLTAYID